MKKTRSSNNEKDYGEFTRPVTVYIGFSDHEEEVKVKEKAPKARKHTNSEVNLKTQSKTESLPVTQTPTQIVKKDESEKLIGRKREAERKEEKKLPVTKKVQKVAANSVPTQPKNLAIRSPQKFTECELFNKDFKMFDEIEIVKKPEFVEKTQLEVKN
jgi:hypothetical protein